MRILQANAGVLTNFEVLDFLRLQGATVDPLHFLGDVTPTECKVFDYLIQSAACSQAREAIDGFMKGSEMFELAEAEINIINLRPSIKPAMHPIVEDCEQRFPVHEDFAKCVLQEVS